MLKSEHLLYTLRSGRAYPKFAKRDKALPWAESVLQILKQHLGLSRGQLDEALRVLEGDSPDYTLVRGLAHLALSEAEFDIRAPLEPLFLRSKIFALASARGYGEREAQAVLEQVADEYGLERGVIQENLYADLPENHLLVRLPSFSPTELLDRYDLAQAQGLLYYATGLTIQAYRNSVGEYKKLFRYLKFYGLMFAVEGDLDSGYRISIDGPTSLFSQTRRYGVRMAALLPALLNVSKWELSAQLQLQGQAVEYALDSKAKLKSHYPKPPEFDSMLESTFASRWIKLDTAWRLEREVEVVDLGGTVFLPDFALRHPAGPTVYLEIVGFWHPDYLRRKLEKVKKAHLDNLILAVSERLNVGKEGLEEVAGIAEILLFKGQLRPEAVLGILEALRLFA